MHPWTLPYGICVGLSRADLVRSGPLSRASPERSRPDLPEDLDLLGRSWADYTLHYATGRAVAHAISHEPTTTTLNQRCLQRVANPNHVRREVSSLQKGDPLPLPSRRPCSPFLAIPRVPSCRGSRASTLPGGRDDLWWPSPVRSSSCCRRVCAIDAADCCRTRPVPHSQPGRSLYYDSIGG